MPNNEEANMVMDLPNTSGMFFTTQRISGADLYVCYDRTLHKFWVVCINSVYSQIGPAPDQGKGQEKLWRKLIKQQACIDKNCFLLKIFLLWKDMRNQLSTIS